jgi:hypothetical protein
MSLIDGLDLHYDRLDTPHCRSLMQLARKWFELSEPKDRDKWQICMGSAMLGEEPGDDRIKLSLPRFDGVPHVCLTSTTGQKLYLEGPDSQALIRDTWTLKHFEDSGRRVFYVSPSLVQALRHTDFAVRCGDVRLPYDCAYYVLPESGITIENDDGTRHPLEGLYIRIGDEPVETSLLNSLRAGSPQIRRLSILAIGTPPSAGEPGNIYTIPVEWREDAACSSEGTCDRSDLPPYISGETVQQIIRLAVNVTLYLSSPDAEREEVVRDANPTADGVRALEANSTAPSKEAAMQQNKQPRRRTSVSFIVVGRSVDFDRHSAPTGRKISVRFMVRGHWRTQPWGPGRTFKRLKWIPPHWNGPESAETPPTGKPFFVANEPITPSETAHDGGQPLVGDGSTGPDALHT